MTDKIIDQNKEALDALNKLSSLASIGYDDLYGDMEDEKSENQVQTLVETIKLALESK